MNVVPDFSTPLHSTDGQEFLLDHRFDFIRLYSGINHAIINVITETGVQRLHVSREIGLMVAEKSLIVCKEMEFIGESEYEKYLQIQERNIEGWLND
jgi:hypothetical protein